MDPIEVHEQVTPRRHAKRVRVTAEDFHAFILALAAVPTFDVTKVAELSGLSRAQIVYVTTHYPTLRRRFGRI